ncbi:hypothetical protein E8E11_010771 [Didymella keratinophila]|nr:hypothetical protein E8E11_010771 [Didymella keratinophila]
MGKDEEEETDLSDASDTEDPILLDGEGSSDHLSAKSEENNDSAEAKEETSESDLEIDGLWDPELSQVPLRSEPLGEDPLATKTEAQGGSRNAGTLRESKFAPPDLGFHRSLRAYDDYEEDMCSQDHDAEPAMIIYNTTRVGVEQQDDDDRRREDEEGRIKRAEVERQRKGKAREGETKSIVVEAQAKREAFARAKPLPTVEDVLKMADELALEQTTSKRLGEFGCQENQIEAMIYPEQQKKLGKQQVGLTPHDPLRIAAQPTYVKIRREYLDIETLHYYDISYEYDVDPNYIVVFREMSQKETDILFEHTRRLRSGRSDRLFVEPDEKDRRGKVKYRLLKKSRTRATSLDGSRPVFKS